MSTVLIHQAAGGVKGQADGIRRIHMASEPGQEPGGRSDENIAAVLRKVIALSDTVTVIYRDKVAKEIGHPVTENHVVEEHPR
ncbi:MAG TPA: hypothetical protein DIT99_15015 [Candidatus Latescibacteria bacterium]|nr:hypothetical protein [Candidatus Latescibacterota bacterium]